MSPLELMKAKAELASVASSRMNMEVKVFELEEAILRVKGEIENQLKRESEISERINQSKKEN